MTFRILFKTIAKVWDVVKPNGAKLSVSRFKFYLSLRVANFAANPSTRLARSGQLATKACGERPEGVESVYGWFEVVGLTVNKTCYLNWGCFVITAPLFARNSSQWQIYVFTENFKFRGF